MEKKDKSTVNPVIALAEQKFGKEKLAELQAQFPGRKLNILVVEDKVAVLMPLTPKALSNCLPGMVYWTTSGSSPK